MNKARPPLAVIAGPTASGKSSLALALAERTGGVIINADSAQIYRDLPILSAAPSATDRQRAEHVLYGTRDGALPCSAADWAVLARAEVRRALDQARLPILVGGTGLYIRTLLQGIAPIPPIDPAVRSAVRAAPVADNRARLEQADAAAASRLNPGDSTRIARALEVVLSTGRGIADWQASREGGIETEVDLRAVVPLPPRDWLYDRCDHRFADMVVQGATDEVAALLERNLDPALPVMRTIGVREISGWLRGETSREYAISAGQQATRNYAKRQYTWFQHQPPADWTRLSGPLEGAAIAAALEVIAPSA